MREGKGKEFKFNPCPLNPAFCILLRYAAFFTSSLATAASRGRPNSARAASI